jgi:Ca2+/Na+ antiporter
VRRPKVHGAPSLAASQAQRRPISASEAQRRRRTTTFTGLLVTTICLLFFAATTKEVTMLYLFAMSFLSLCGYVYVLVSMRQRTSSWGPAARGDDWLRR